MTFASLVPVPILALLQPATSPPRRAAGARDRARHLPAAGRDAARPRPRRQHRRRRRPVRTGRRRHRAPSVAQRRHPRVRARAEQPIAAIVNTHWHLDHSSGNRRVKAAHPAAKVYTTRAIDRALAPADSSTRNLAARASGRPIEGAATAREETELFFATMEALDSLRPDVPVDSRRADARRTPAFGPRRRRCGHRRRPVALRREDRRCGDRRPRDAAGAVLRDRVPGTVADRARRGVGDAVPHRRPRTWRADDARRLRHLSPGVRRVPRLRRRATAPPATCAAGWTKDVGPLLETDADRTQATEYATYYVEFLRKNGGASPDCRAK